MSNINNSIKAAKTKRLKLGLYQSFSLIFVIALLIGINVAVSNLNLSFDLTVNKKFTLSTTTLNLIKTIESKVAIYPLFSDDITGLDIDTVKELLNQYKVNSSNITVEYKDPNTYPTFIEGYSKLGAAPQYGGIIVESDKRFTVINPGDIIITQYDYQTYEQYTMVDVEAQVTNAISYVNEENTAVVYSLTGHNELLLSDAMQSKIALSNYDLKELNLLTSGEIPVDCEVLVLSSPQRDYSSEEAQMISDYLSSGGRALVFADAGLQAENFSSILNNYGVSINDAVIVEGNGEYYLPNSSPLSLLPQFTYNEIATALKEKNVYTLVPLAAGVKTNENIRESLYVEPVLVTSETAYGKINPNAKTIEKEDGDIDGPFDVAVTVTEQNNSGNETKLVVVSSSTVFDEGVNDAIAGGNLEFIIGSINWLQGKAGSIYIMPKTESFTSLLLNSTQAITLMVASVVLLPLIIFGVGAFVWYRRKKR